MRNPFTKKLLKPLFFLAALIIICGFLARILTDSETLSDYAANNPEIAYGESVTHIDEVKEENSTQTESVDEEKGKVEPMNTIREENDTKELLNNDAPLPDCTVYQDDFFYEPLTDEIKTKITGISYPVTAAEAETLSVPVVNMLTEDTVPAISYNDLRYLSVLYYDFNGEIQTGELICNKGIAQDLVEIFYELYLNEYQIEKIKLIDEYQGDDTASMTDNNTSCFNYRVVDGTSSLSKHALGCAIDINPFYNPYIIFGKGENGSDYISPAGSELYADRSQNFAYKIDENDLCYRLFKEHGFTWGGDWNSCKDYQHFQKVVE